MSFFQKQDEIKYLLAKLSDDNFWVPFRSNPQLLQEFNDKLDIVIASEKWPKNRNKDKGNVLEEFSKFIFQHFTILESIKRTEHTTDNEIDLEVIFNSNLPVPFIAKIKNKLISECKNMHSKSVDVGMVSKLVELCINRKCGMGMFISVRGLSGRGWRCAEGKRRKLFIKEDMPCISFTVKELEKLKEPGVNFYTMIKQKYDALIDEVDDNSPSLKKSKERDPDFIENLLSCLDTFENYSLITGAEKDTVLARIKNKYGDAN